MGVCWWLHVQIRCGTGMMIMLNRKKGTLMAVPSYLSHCKGAQSDVHVQRPDLFGAVIAQGERAVPSAW